MTPLKPIAPATRIVLGILFFVLFIVVWSIATFGGFVSKTFLADPLTMLREGVNLFVELGFIKDIGITVWRVVGGFVLAAVFAVPLGSRWERTGRSARSSSRSYRSRAICPRQRSFRC